MVTTRDLEWVAGFLEGEGCFTWNKRGKASGTPHTSAAQVQKWPLTRIQRLLGGSLYYCDPPSRKPNQRPQWRWHLSGIGLMMTVYPLMSPERQEKIRYIISQWKARPAQTGIKLTCPRGHAYDYTKMVQGRLVRA